MDTNVTSSPVRTSDLRIMTVKSNCDRDQSIMPYHFCECHLSLLIKYIQKISVSLKRGALNNITLSGWMKEAYENNPLKNHVFLFQVINEPVQKKNFFFILLEKISSVWMLNFASRRFFIGKQTIQDRYYLTGV